MKPQSGPEDEDEAIRPRTHWLSTGLVRAGEAGSGCALNCVYCNQVNINFDEQLGRQAGYLSPQVDAGISINSRLMIGKRVAKYVPVETLISALKSYPYYNCDSTVLIENFNDPGVDWTKSLEIVRRLMGEIGHRGALVFITKMGVSGNHLREMVRLQTSGAKLICFVTYSGLPFAIEPMNPQIRVRTIRGLHESGIPVVLAMRPLIEGVNATEQCVTQTLEKTAGLVEAIVIGGLFVYRPYTVEAFQRAGYPLPDSYLAVDYNVAKTLPESVRRLVRSTAAGAGLTVPIHDHTSCAVAHTMTTFYRCARADRLAHWAGDVEPKFQRYCVEFCDSRQIAMCKGKSMQGWKEATRLAEEQLKRIGFAGVVVTPSVSQAGLLLVVGASLLADQLFTVEEACGWDVDNLPGYEGLVHRSRQALEQGLGVSFDSVFVDAILVGQEWHMFVDGVIDGGNNELAVRWLRGRNRARIQIHNARTLVEPGACEALESTLIQQTHGLQHPKEIVLGIRRVAAKARRRGGPQWAA